MKKTLHFAHVEGGGAASGAIPPGERGWFFESPDIPLDVSQVHVFGGGKAISMEVGDVVYESAGSPFYKKMVGLGGHVDPWTPVHVAVENDTDCVITPRVVLVGSSKEGGWPDADFAFALRSEGRGRIVRRWDLSSGQCHPQVRVPCGGRLSRIAMRSNGSGIDVLQVRVGAHCLTVGGEQPIEFYGGDGWAFRPIEVPGFCQMGVFLNNVSGEPRWVEIDYDFEVEDGIDYDFEVEDGGAA